MKSWVGLVGWPATDGRHTHVSGHPLAAGRAQDRESTSAEDWRSTTEPTSPAVARISTNSPRASHHTPPLSPAAHRWWPPVTAARRAPAPAACTRTIGRPVGSSTGTHSPRPISPYWCQTADRTWAARTPSGSASAAASRPLQHQQRNRIQQTLPQCTTNDEKYLLVFIAEQKFGWNLSSISAVTIPTHATICNEIKIIIIHRYTGFHYLLA